MREVYQMKPKPIILTGAALIIVAAAIWLSQRDSDVVPDPDMRHQPAKVTNDSSHPRSSRSPSLPDQARSDNTTKVSVISPVAITSMKEVGAHMSKVLESVSDDATGKRSLWFAKLKTWHTLLERAVQTQRQDDLFALVPIAAEFYARNRETEPLAEPIDDLRFWMGHLGYSMVVELGKIISESNGSLDDRTASIAITVFAVEGIQSDPWPEDESPPIDAAGVLIARPEIMQSLGNLPIDQLSFFLQAQSAETFFRRYEQNGDGMPALRRRYSENREALRSSFNNLANRVATHQASTQAK
jgi:hypothetical protein